MLIPLGDSVCKFNPVFGQGMSVAAQEAVVLGRLLNSRRDRADPLDGLAADYLSQIQALLEAPWATAQGDFVFAETRGARPPDLEKRLRYGAALMRLAAEDPETHRIVMEVRQSHQAAERLARARTRRARDGAHGSSRVTTRTTSRPPRAAHLTTSGEAET